MAREIAFPVGDDEVDIAVEATTRVPARVVGLSGVCPDGNLIHLAPAQELAHVNIETDIAVVRTTDTLTVEKDITHEHDALEVQQDTLVLPLLLRCKFVTVPARTHLLKATGTQPTAHIAACITVVRSLTGIGSHPVLPNQEVVGQVHHLICGLESL